MKQVPFSLVKDMITYAWAKAIPGVAVFLSVLLFIRWLGPEEFGYYSLLFSFVNMCTAFSFAWFNQSIIRYFSRLQKQGLIASAISGGWLFSCLISLALIVVLQLLQFPKPSSFLLLSVLSISMGSFSTILVLLQSNRQASKVVQLNLLQASLFIFCPVIAVYFFGKFHQSILIGLIFAYLLPSLFYFLVKGRTRWYIDFEESFLSLKKFFSFGFPISFWFATSLSLRFLDRYLLEHYVGIVQMGSYAVYAEIFTRFFSLILFPITMALHPFLTHQWNNGQKKLVVKTLKWGLVLQGGIFAICILALLGFQGWVLKLLSFLAPGLNIEMSGVVLPIFIGGFLWQWSLLIHKPLELMEKTNKMLIFMLVAVSINIMGNVIFIPKIGVIATAYTLIASALVYNLLTIIVSRDFWIGKFQL